MFNSLLRFFGIGAVRKRQKISDELADKVTSLRKEGKTFRAISEKLGLTVGQVSGIVYRAQKMRNHRHQYTEADDAFIISEWKRGATVREIAKALGRSSAGVSQRVYNFQEAGRLDKRRLRVVA